MQYFYLNPDNNYYSACLKPNAVMLYKKNSPHKIVYKRELFTESEIDRTAVLASNKSLFATIELKRCRTFKTSDGRRFQVPDNPFL